MTRAKQPKPKRGAKKPKAKTHAPRRVMYVDDGSPQLGLALGEGPKVVEPPEHWPGAGVGVASPKQSFKPSEPSVGVARPVRSFKPPGPGAAVGAARPGRSLKPPEPGAAVGTARPGRSFKAPEPAAAASAAKSWRFKPPEPGAAAAKPGRLSPELVEDLVDAGSREHYADASLYDYEYRRRRADVTFYRELAKRLGGPILELGAGSGRLTTLLARDGHRVVALDRSASMLDRLRARVAALPPSAAARVQVIDGDLCTFHVAKGGRRAGIPAGGFPLVIAAFNVLEHLYTRGEFAACMARIAAHLAPGGTFAFDVQLPDLGWLNRDPAKRWAKTRFTHPTTKRVMFYSTNHDYDPVGQIVNIRLYYDPADGHGPSRVVKLSQRKYFPAELEALIAHAGFRVAERYGDFAWRPLDGAAESQVLICVREPIRRRK